MQFVTPRKQYRIGTWTALARPARGVCEHSAFMQVAIALSRTLFHDVPCRFCYKSICPMGHQHCLSLVPPQAVVDATLGLLQDTAGP